MSKTNICKKIVLTFFFLLIPVAAMAYDAEYIVYGGYDAIVNSFVRISQVFANNEYKALFFVLMASGIFFGGASYYLKSITGANVGSPVAWLIPAVIGMVIYLAMVVPKGNLTIYDEGLTGQHQTVPDIPDGIIMVVAVLNKIEVGLIDIVLGSSVTGVEDYKKHCGGKGFLGLQQLTSMPITALSTSLDQSVRQYINDCVTFALTDGTSGITIESLRQKSTSKNELAKAANPALFTTYYSDIDPGGTTMTCSAAWTALNTDMTVTNVSERTKKIICGQLGYDVTNSSQFIACQALMTDITNDTNIGNMPGTNIDDFIMQTYIAQRLEEIYRSGDASAASNYGFMMNASGTMRSANEWIPTMKAALTAISVGLIPFLALFIPTPLFGRGIALMLGFFIWLTAWGVTDAIIHSYIIDYSVHQYKQINWLRLGPTTDIGMDSLLFYPSQNAKILAMFGTLRMSGMMLATVLTGALVKFGGSAMAHMSGSLSGQMQSTGMKGEWTTSDPGGRMSEVTKLRNETMPAQAWVNAFAPKEAVQAATVGKMGTTLGNSKLISNMGMGGAAQAIGDSSVSRAIMGTANVGAWQKSPGSIPGAIKSLEHGATQQLAGAQSQHDVFANAQKANVLPSGVSSYYEFQQWMGQITATQSFRNNEAFAKVANANSMSVDQLAQTTSAQNVAKPAQQSVSAAGGTGWTRQEAQDLANDLKSLPEKPTDTELTAIAQKHSIFGGLEGAKAMHNSWKGNLAGSEKTGYTSAGEQSFINGITSTEDGTNNIPKKDIGAKALDTQRAIGKSAGATDSGHGDVASKTTDETYRAAGVNSEAGKVALSQQSLEADKLAFKALLPGVESNDSRYYNSDKSLTTSARQIAKSAQAGTDISPYLIGDAAFTPKFDKDGRFVSGEAKGVNTAGNTKGRQAMVASLRKVGLDKAASYIENDLSGKSFEYMTSVDSKGQIAGISFRHGAEGKDIDFAHKLEGRTVEFKNNRLHDTTNKKVSGFSDIDLSRSERQNAGAVTIGDTQYQSGGHLTITGNNFVYEGRPVDSDEMRTAYGRVIRKGDGTFSLLEMGSDGKGGKSFSDSVVATEIVEGKLSQLEMALRGTDADKSNYAKAFGSELARTLTTSNRDSAAASESVYLGLEANLGIQTPLGGAKGATGTRLDSTYQQSRSVDVKAVEAEVLSYLKSGKDSGTIMNNLQDLRSNYIGKGNTALRHQGNNVVPTSSSSRRVTPKYTRG